MASSVDDGKSVGVICLDFSNVFSTNSVLQPNERDSEWMDVLEGEWDAI